MKNLMILVKMQLKERLNFKRLDVENVNVFQIVVSVLGALVKFAMVLALCVAFLLVANLLGLFSLMNTVPPTVISIVFTAMLLVSIISCVAGLTKSMYYSRDNAVLLTLPATPTQVYLSKLVIFFIFEMKRNISFTVPLFIAYYYTHGYPIIAYPWMLFCMIFISLFTVSIGALLSIPAMWIANFFRQHRWLQMTSLAAVVAVASVSLFYAISLIPENLDILATWTTTFWQIQDFLNMYAEKFSLVYDITRLLLGEMNVLIIKFPFGATALRFLLVFGSTAVLLAAGMLIVRPMFYKMASKPFEYLKKSVKPKPNVERKRRWSAVFYEWLIALKSTDRMYSNVGILIATPMLIFLLNKMFIAMNTDKLGDSMIVAFNVLIVLLVILNSNCYAASIFSKEGRSSYLIKTQPSKYPILILSKLLPNTCFGVLSVAATFFIMLYTIPATKIQILLLAAGLGMAYLAHMLYSAELDLMNPQVELYATVGNTENNPNETKSTLVAFLASFLAAGAVLLLLIEGEGLVYIKFFGVALAVLAYRVWMFFAKLRLYYADK